MVRDPRASLASLMQGGKEWTKPLATFKDHCQLYYEDLSMEKSMPGSRYSRFKTPIFLQLLIVLLLRYVRVRYEDLVSKEHTEDILRELYDFMGIPFAIEAKLSGLLHGGNGGYYGLSRNQDFDPNHWTKELSKDVRNQTIFFPNLNNQGLINNTEYV